MQQTKTSSKRMAFVVDESVLRRLDEVLKTWGDPSYEVQAKDGTVTPCPDLDCLLDQSNSQSRAITRISAESRPMKRDVQSYQHLNVNLNDSRFDNVDYRVVGDSDRVFILANRLDEWLTEIRPWYAPIAALDRSDVTTFFLAPLSSIMVIFLVALGVLIGLQVQSIGTHFDMPVGSAILGGVGAAVFTYILISLGTHLGPVKDRLFPLATFAIGYGQKRYEQMRKIHDIALRSVVLAIVVGVIVKIISARLAI
jgi:hypothetical protein